MKQCLFFVLFLSCCMAMPAFAAKPLETIKNVTLVKGDPRNDGDSFMVKMPVETPKGKELHLRLYHVDCPETTASTDAEWKRIFKQQDHFVLEDHRAVVHFGKQATEYVKQVLSKPFTIHTSYADALGRSTTDRYYAFIETHDGRDLGHLLVEQGLARVHGETHHAPDGTPSEEVQAELKDMRWVAMLNRAGIWGATKLDRLPDVHKRQREEERKWEELFKIDCGDPLDLNTASYECLQELDGIGPKKAENIIADRPYRCVKDLLKVSGIGKKTLEEIWSLVTVGTEQPE